MKIISLILFLLTRQVLWADVTWNQFRGPGGSGLAPDSKPPLELSDATLAWQVPLPPGHSSPVLAGGRLFITALEEEKALVTLAFDKVTGQQLWRQVAPIEKLEKVHEAGSPAASTPYADQDRVVVYFGSYGMLCYDHDGNELWKRPMPTPKSLYGMSTSPISYQEKLILVLDNDANLDDSKLSKSKVIALDKASGKILWETRRPLIRSGWSTPTILRHADGPDELVILGHGRVYGYDPESGLEKWFVNGFSRETISVPVTGNGLVYVSASMLGGVPDADPDPEPFWKALLPFDKDKNGKIERSEMDGDFTFPIRPDLPIGHPGFGIPLPKDEAKREERRNGILKWVDKDKDGAWSQEEFLNHLSFNRGKPNLMAIRPGGSGDVTESHVAWSLHRNIPEIPSPIYFKERLYMVRNGGVLAAVDAATGETIYKKRLGATGQYSPSPIIARNHLYLFSNTGKVTLVPTGDDFSIAFQTDLEEDINATPALDQDTLYLRTGTRLRAYRKKN